jgi:glycosyltransferase involved in cell wall biosynthesis
MIESIANGLKNYERNNFTPNFEIVVLDDGSSDNTPLEILSANFGGFENKIIRNEKPSGIAGAFETLYAKASGEWVLLLPGDFQWRMDAILKILNRFFDLGGSVAVSTIRKQKTGYSWLRRITSSVFALLARLAVRNGSKLDPGSVKLLPNIPNSMRKFSATPSNEIERLIIAKRITCQRLEAIQVSTHLRENGTSSSGGFKLVFNSFAEYLRIVLHYSIR